MPLRATAPWRLAIRSHARLPCSSASPARPRFLSSRQQGHTDRPTLFTASIPKSLTRDPSTVVEKLKSLCHKTAIASSDIRGHDAAVVLATPGLTNLVGSEVFLSELASFLSVPGQGHHFTILSAIIDHVPQGPAPNQLSAEGLSILRGPSDEILPSLGNPEFAREKGDLDTIGALTFSLGDSNSVSVPLTRTIFHNGKPSTLVTSRYDLSSCPPRLTERIDAVRQHVRIPLAALSGSASAQAPHLWLPLRAVSSARNVTESFGNILRRLGFDGKSAPASSELEANIGSIRKAILDAAPQTEAALPGVWAMVNPAPGTPAGPRDWHIYDHLMGDSSGNAAEAIRRGGRPFRLLSGGGGWGDKAGLLSLDPETSPFPLSEEEQMRNLFGVGGGSDYAPVGSEVQFFIPELGAEEAQPSEQDSHGLVFGVSPYALGEPPEERGAEDVSVAPNQFGALSDEAIYVESEGASPFKLSVPGARLSIP